MIENNKTDRQLNNSERISGDDAEGLTVAIAQGIDEGVCD